MYARTLVAASLLALTTAGGAAGFNYFFGPKLALDLNLRYTVGEFNAVKIGGESVSSDDGVWG